MIGHKTFGLKSFTTELLTTTLIGATLLGPAAAQGLPDGSVPTPEGSAPHAAGSDNLLTLLPLLLTSPDRRRLAADLEASIRNGDHKRAENSLNAAIEVGTLAIVLVDHLNNPDLVAALQSLGIRGDARPAPAESCPAPSAVTPVNLADMQQALDQERSFSATVSQSLTGLMQERSALEAHLKKEQESQVLAASEMQQALQREQDQNQAVIRELEVRQEEVRALRAAMEQDKASAASNASELEALLRREREQRDKVERQLASAEKTLRDLQASKEETIASGAARVAELEKALGWARARHDMLAQELVDTAAELHALQEPHRPSATPVVFRLAATGTEPPLAPPQEEAPAQIAPPAPAQGVRPPVAETGRALLDVTAALPPRQPPSVVIAALPDGIGPLPLGTAAVPPVKAEPPAAAEPGGTAPAEPPKADERLILRAEELFRKGDVSGARLLLERALDGGNARAAFLLAETFDPNVLSRLGVMGIRGDPAKARELYGRARAMGMAKAGERMEALR
ncbi:MAG TPA: hypothetical protein VGU19_05885 [Microvirga sp.]|jgi:hypothetical protein|nr:hypothetical protein [Microvirga sp.]